MSTTWKHLSSIFRVLSITVLRLGFMTLLLTMLAYFTTSIYDFPETTPFAGNKLHNPYKNANPKNWNFSNFHAHGKAWFGLSHGKGHYEDVYHTYFNRLGYDIVGISNYQKIDENADEVRRIRTYEHGFSPMKNHHIVIGSDRVCWKEYPWIQYIHQKQHVLRILQEHDEGKSVIAIAHPKRGKAYSLEDMKYLTHYDCIEAFNHLSTSKEHWDAALSAGHPVYLLASDDTHDHEDLYKVARHGTMINTEKLTEENVVRSLKNGKSFGVEIKKEHPENFLIRKNKIKSLATIEKVTVKDDLLQVQFSDTCDSILFIGQHGAIKKIAENTSIASYSFQPNDTYIRTEAIFKTSKHIFYLNPVFRYEGDHPKKKLAVVNLTKTVLYRIFMALCILLLSTVYFRWERKKWLISKSS